MPPDLSMKPDGCFGSLQAVKLKDEIETAPKIVDISRFLFMASPGDRRLVYLIGDPGRNVE